MLNKTLDLFLGIFFKRLEIILGCQRECLYKTFLIIYEAAIILIGSFLFAIMNQIANTGSSNKIIQPIFLAFNSLQVFLLRVIIWKTEKFKGLLKLLLISSFFSYGIYVRFIIFLLEIVIALVHKKIILHCILPIIFLLNTIIYFTPFLFDIKDCYSYLTTILICIYLPKIDFKIKLTSHKTFEYLKSLSINFNEIVTKDDSKTIMASIVHDLRNPVSAVHSIISVLSNSKNITSEQRDQLESALFSCDFQLTIINNILDMNKIQANKFQMLHSEFSLPNLVQMIFKMQANVARKKNINFHSNIINTLPEIVVGDKNRISQILLNIIGNSIKFTNEGEIIITLKWEENWSEIDFSKDSMRQSIKGTSESGDLESLYINELISENKSKDRKYLKLSNSNDEEVKHEMSVLQKMNNYFPLQKVKINFGKSKSHSKKKLRISIENEQNNECIARNFLTEVSNSKRPRLFSKDHTIKKIALSRIKDFESEEGKGVLFIEISDTGEGIKEEEQGKLFQPYSQAKSNISVLGTGLGLWISKQLTNFMGGKIKLFSVFEKGTCIRIAIPLTFTCQATRNNYSKDSDNLQNVQEYSPHVPRHFIDSLRSKFEIIILYDHLCLLNQIQKIKSNIHKMKINFSFKIFEFNQNFNIKDCELDSLFIIICSFDFNKTIEIVSDIKNASIMGNHHNYLFSVFNDQCEGLESHLQGYVENCTEFSIQKVEETIFNYARLKAKIGKDKYSTFEEACLIVSGEFSLPNQSIYNSAILVADDDYFSRSALVYLMKNNGYNNIIEVENGEEAFEYFKNQMVSIRLIILDKRMPKLDGIGACQKIRMLEKSLSRPATPVIGLTGDRENYDFSQAGVNIVVEKPIRNTQLISLLNNMLK